MTTETLDPKLQNRRSVTRFQLRLPLKIRTQNEAISAITKDVSSKGVFFYVHPEHEFVSKLDDMEFEIMFPPEITLTTKMTVTCRGKIIRRDPVSAAGVGMAASITKYEFPHVAEA